MQVSVKGKNNKLTKKEIRYITNYFGRLLLSPRLEKNIFLEITNSKKMKNSLWGVCGPLDWDDRRPRDFEIFLNPNITKKQQIRTLAHEMTHLMQYAKGELRHLNSDLYKWMGKRMRLNYDQYNKMPWEVQARLSENWLIHFYTQHMKYKKDK